MTKMKTTRATQCLNRAQRIFQRQRWARERVMCEVRVSIVVFKVRERGVTTLSIIISGQTRVVHFTGYNFTPI